MSQCELQSVRLSVYVNVSGKYAPVSKNEKIGFKIERDLKSVKEHDYSAAYTECV